MPYCTNCGMPVSGNFCNNCGTKVFFDAAPMQPQQPAAQEIITPVQKTKVNLLPWILLAAVVVIAIAVIALILNGQSMNDQIMQPSGEPPVFTAASPISPAETVSGTQPIEASAETEYSSPETDPTIAEEAALFSTNNYTIGDKVFFSNSSGIFYFEGANRYNIYPEESPIFASDGKTLYTVSNRNTIVQVDVETGDANTLFRVDAYNAIVCGATQEEIYIGTQQSEEDWWGYTVSAYSHSGTILRSYGSNLDPEMQDGYLILSSYRSDVRPQSVTVIQADTQKTVYETSDTILSWDVQIIDGAVYSLEIEDFFNDQSASMKLQRITSAGKELLLSFDAFASGFNACGTMSNGILSLIDFSSPESNCCYRIPDCSKILPPFDAVSVCGDQNGNVYCEKDGTVYRQDSSGTFQRVAEFSGTFVYIWSVMGDYVYYYNGTDYYACFAPLT